FASRLTAFTLVSDANAEQIAGGDVEPGFFELLGVQPRIGRTFVAGDAQPGKDNVVLMSESLWRRRFGADPSLVGRTITLGGGKYDVIGILPGSFRFPFAGGMD